jgi:hypothetical protein
LNTTITTSRNTDLDGWRSVLAAQPSSLPSGQLGLRPSALTACPAPRPAHRNVLPCRALPRLPWRRTRPPRQFWVERDSGVVYSPEELRRSADPQLADPSQHILTDPHLLAGEFPYSGFWEAVRTQ